MKGIIFNVFESFVSDNFGEETWEVVLEESKVDTDVYVAPKTYDDSLFLKLLTTAVSLKNLKIEDAVRAFGKYTYPRLASHAPSLVAPYKTPLELLEALDGIIHVEVRKLMEGANPPKFNVTRINESELELEYISKRNLPVLVEGLIEGLAESFHQQVEMKVISQAGDSTKFHILFR